MKEVVITAGGTREKIDDVRYVGNFSSGRLGHKIAEVYAGYDDTNVTLIAPDETIERFGLPDGVVHESFVSSRDLREKLLGIKAADVVVHLAAVADYIPDFRPGKISSENEDLTITMKRAPKIISELRGHFGDDTTLVGFKLLSGAQQYYHLSDAAQQQIRDNDLDLCVANDLSDVRSDTRKIRLVRKAIGLTFYGISVEYFIQDHQGTLDSAARYIVDNIVNKGYNENRETTYS